MKKRKFNIVEPPPGDSILGGPSQVRPRLLGPGDLAEMDRKSRELRATIDANLGQRKKDELEELRNDNTNCESPGIAGGHSQGATPSLQAEPLSDEMSLGSMADAVFDTLYSQDVKRYEPKWKRKVASFQENWESQLEELADSYLKWKNGNNSAPPPASEPMSETSDPPVPFEIGIVDMFNTHHRTTHVSLPQSERAAPHLVSRGYLPTTPVYPSLAISLRTLEFYKVLRQRKASFSIEAFTKVLCDLYGHPYRRRWKEALAGAFDVFTSIQLVIEQRVNVALKRDSEDWRVLNACPGCFYVLEDEEPLDWGVLLSMDGNTSLKRIADKGSADDRIYKGVYFIPTAEGNLMENKGKTGDPQPKPPNDPENEQDDVDIDDQRNLQDCTKNWKAAQSDNSKKAMGFFDETGIFASACRHGIVLWLIDMVKSGELAQYPLAIINRALNLLGNRLAVGYDIGCTFAITVANSQLGQRFRDAGCRCVVPSYHGYAHNFKCQTQNHPNNIKGIGLEDFETMERLFSGSNTTAGLVRNATKYRRRMYIEMYMKQADADKYLAIGDMLLGNYQQALGIVTKEGELLDETLALEGLTRAQLDDWQVEQQEYFTSTLGHESEIDLLRVAYVEMLWEWQAALRDAENKSSAFMHHTIPEHFDIQHSNTTTYQSATSDTLRLENARRRARQRAWSLDVELQDFETQLGVSTRWGPGVAHYEETVIYINQRAHRRALDNLQRLVVQRLFELHRLNLSGIGYKARTLLAQSMRKRSGAIRTAVDKYNKALCSIGRTDTLDFEKASKYSFVEEFELLKDGQADLSQTRWKEPLMRETMKRHQRIKRAREEIQRLNVEVQRVYSSIKNEESTFKMVLHSLMTSNDPLFSTVQDYAHRRIRVNAVIIARLEKIVKLEGYSGSALAWKRRKGEPEAALTSSYASPSLPDTTADVEDGGIALNQDEDEAQVGGFIDVLADLSVG